MLKAFSFVLLLGALNLFTTAWSQVTPAPDCPSNVTHCQLPACRCFSTAIPGGVTPATTPQIVYLTFDDAVNAAENYPFYEEVLYSRKNPNNASISATFFISHEYNDYSRTHELYRHGHEIALHSITHKSDTSYWRGLSVEGWVSEIVDHRSLVAHFANIPENQIRGMRAPFLQPGGDNMYKALADNRFEWESSRPTWQFRPLLWPYTNDYKSSQDCALEPCPVGRYPGFWTMPLVDFLGGDLFPCAMVDQCLPSANTTAETFTLLKHNFDDHYYGNKAPFGVYTHAAWILNRDFGEQRKQGYIQFLDYLATLPDVYIVSLSKALDWIRTPVPLADIDEIDSWKPTDVIANGCPTPANCRFVGDQTPDGNERYMMSCKSCTTIRNYPWLGNPLGL